MTAKPDQSSGAELTARCIASGMASYTSLRMWCGPSAYQPRLSINAPINKPMTRLTALIFKKLRHEWARIGNIP